jgi:hypothetical protein
MYVKLKHVKRTKVKGLWYYYHRKTNERLPDDPDERAARVVVINAGLSKKDGRAGEFNELIADYKRSPDYRHLADSTKKGYSRRLDWLGEKFGDLNLDAIDRGFVLALRDQLQAKPRSATTSSKF